MPRGRRARGAQVAYFRDVTRADELDRTKSRFLATAAHELRTPIAVITGYTEFLEDSEPPARQRGEILATMRRHGDQITGIVTELLDLARIEARAGRDFTLLRQPLAPVVRGFVETFRIGEDAASPARGRHRRRRSRTSMPTNSRRRSAMSCRTPASTRRPEAR